MVSNMPWKVFLAEVMQLVDIDKENVDGAITAMSWSFHKKNPLLLTGASGYSAMIQQIKVLKDPSAAIILSSLPEPRRSHGRPGSRSTQTTLDENGLEVKDRGHDNSNTLFGKKACTPCSCLNETWLMIFAACFG